MSHKSQEKAIDGEKQFYLEQKAAFNKDVSQLYYIVYLIENLIENR